MCTLGRPDPPQKLVEDATSFGPRSKILLENFAFQATDEDTSTQPSYPSTPCNKGYALSKHGNRDAATGCALRGDRVA